jgi:hypothetical protein
LNNYDNEVEFGNFVIWSWGDMLVVLELCHSYMSVLKRKMVCTKGWGEELRDVLEWFTVSARWEEQLKRWLYNMVTAVNDNALNSWQAPREFSSILTMKSGGNEGVHVN